ncbi:hypothetical protein [Roseivirga sp. E12]|uniref:hypothetical protein n=1 Tax=Roseivirga sp. E12 TaxID=2819237 RepID=UPI001ABC2AA8|nr:hypothetical protein [Roseivirga sp. E12]MBO3697195.1 hypothetical protein [Roseivirga sp. E12]
MASRESFAILRPMNKPHTPLLLRITSGRIPPLVVGVMVSIPSLIALTLVFKTDNILLSWNNYENVASFYTLSFGYLIYISRLINNSHTNQFNQLLSYTDLSESQRTEWSNEFKQHRRLWPETLIAAAVGFGHAYFAIIRVILKGESTFEYLSWWRAFHLIMIWIIITQSISIYTRNMTIMNKLSQHIKVDLLNLQRFMPLTSAGVISMLAFTGVYAILFIFAFNVSDLTTNPAMLVLLPTIWIMIRRPLKGVRKRIIEAKQREITLIEAAIEGDNEALKQSRIGNNLQNINVIDLIGYKKTIENTLEIPVNIPTASRFIFYLIIPVLTWIAASMVDKVIDYLIK